MIHKTEENFAEATRLRAMQMPFTEISKRLGIHRRTISYWFEDMGNEDGRRSKTNWYYDWEHTRRLSLEEILLAVHQELHVPPRELMGTWRDHHLVDARFVTYYFMRRNTPLSLPAIGRLIGDRDHCTVANGLKKIAKNPKKYEPMLTAVAARLGVPAR